MSDVTITALDNGPYKVEGVVSVIDSGGGTFETSGRPAVFLCRCGASTNKPFCDGTHSKLGFEAAERAAAEADAQG